MHDWGTDRSLVGEREHRRSRKSASPLFPFSLFGVKAGKSARGIRRENGEKRNALC
jgi:hypothetical protein